MKRFREIYDKELSRICDSGGLDKLFLNHGFVRGFVYEVCKQVVVSQQGVQADACTCTELEDGADACPHWEVWGKCKKRTA